MLKKTINLLLIISLLTINNHIQTACPAKYSINLIWLNQKLDLNQTNLLVSAQLANLLDWATKHPGSQVNLWLDSKLTSKQAIKNLRLIIAQVNQNNIKLCDIRKLKTAQQYPELFTCKIPIYFRVDLIKIIITIASLKKDPQLCFVYTDFDIKPICRRKLFDRKTCRLLKKYNFILAKSNNRFGFENGFQIFNYQENLILALEQALVQTSIKQAHNFIIKLIGQQDPASINNLKIERAHFQETVFREYPNMLIHFYTLESKIDPKQIFYGLKPAVPTKKIKMPTSTSSRFELENC